MSGLDGCFTSEIDDKKAALYADARHRRAQVGAPKFAEVWTTMQLPAAASGAASPNFTGAKQRLKAQVRALPVLGPAARWVATILKLPSRLGRFDSEVGNLQAQVRQLESHVGSLLEQNHEYRLGQQRLVGQQDALDIKIDGLCHQLVKIAEQAAKVQPAPLSTGEKSSSSLTPPNSGLAGAALEAVLDGFYWNFEARFRGSEELIRSRLEFYTPYLTALRERLPDKTVVDVGCGRGEWLQLVQTCGLKARGIDMNERMVANCQMRQLDVSYGDATVLLGEEAENSLAAVTGFHIVEHLPFEALLRLFLAAYRALAPGGLVLFETPNPENPSVGSCDFYTDPTHRNPIPPVTLGFMLESAGFRRQECVRLRAGTPSSIPTDPSLAAIVASFHQGTDYAILGFKSGPGV